MKIILVGYGRMGKEIERVATNRGHEVICRVDAIEGIGDTTELDSATASKADVVIEFALPEMMDKNVKKYAEYKLPAVIGTTGWSDKLDEYRELIKENNSSFLYGSNFSIGAHIMFRLVEEAAKLINPVEDYDVMINEFHHKNKKDSPSGTALTIAEKVIDNCSRKNRLLTQQINRAIEPDELHITAVRGGSIPGTHSVIMDSEADTIEITHTARSRGGFVLGAVMAAEWLIEQKTGFYSVEDFIESLF